MNAAPNPIDETLSAWMKSALAKAIEGIAGGESPFGAAVFHPESGLLSVEHNQVGSSHRPSAHAEVQAIDVASETLGKSTLEGHWLVTTGEPCPMCLATAAMAGIQNIVFGAPANVIEAAGYATLGLSAAEFAEQLNVNLTIHGPILKTECSAILINHPKSAGGRMVG